MAKTNAFKIAELIRVFSYDTSNDVITTNKSLGTKTRSSDTLTTTATTQVNDGSAVTMTQYGTLKSTSLATFDADISGANVRLRVTPASSSSTVINFHRTVVE